MLRQPERSAAVDAHRGALAVRDLHDLPLERVSHRLLIERCWELRGNLTAGDAACVALAEALDGPLLTANRRLAAAPGLACAAQTVPGARCPVPGGR